MGAKDRSEHQRARLVCVGENATPETCGPELWERLEHAFPGERPELTVWESYGPGLKGRRFVCENPPVSAEGWAWVRYARVLSEWNWESEAETLWWDLRALAGSLIGARRLLQCCDLDWSRYSRLLGVMHAAREDFKRRGRPAYEDFYRANVGKTARRTGDVEYPEGVDWKLWGVNDVLSEFIQHGKGNLPHPAEFERFDRKLRGLADFEIKTGGDMQDAVYGRTRTTVFYRGEPIITSCDREGSLGS